MLMFYGSEFSWRKVEKNKRFPWITLPEWHLTENSMVSTSATPFIWCLCFLYAYVSPCKPMFYGLVFSWRKIEKHKRFPWIMRWTIFLEWHQKENSMVSTSTTQFIWRPCFPYVYVSPCEAHVLRLSIFMEEDRETQKIPLNYVMNYAPGAASDGEFLCKYLRYSIYLTPMFSVCVRESL